MFSDKELINLAIKEGWGVERNPTTDLFEIHTGEDVKPLAHPYQIHLGIYRNSPSIETKVKSMIRVNHILWPEYEKTWNSWDERRFEVHCGDYRHIVLAGGAATAKSNCTARIATIFWLSNPTRNTCLIASTTLDSLERRIWGYAVKFIELASKRLPIPAVIRQGNTPKIVHPKTKDKIHGMFAVAIRSGTEEKVLSTLIGNHPDYGIMVVLDESTDMSPSIAKSFPNLEQGVEFAQFWAIGNSNDRMDLHGALATPKVGWNKLNPSRDDAWLTVHDKGICLYFNPEKSPAITDPDPVKRALLGKFLMTSSKLESLRKKFGVQSDSYFRFVLGFWKQQSMDRVLLDPQFLKNSGVDKGVEWGGYVPLKIVAGLDPAFQVGGKGCVLRLAMLGVDVKGLYVLDFKGDDLMFKLDVRADSQISGEMQLVNQIIEVLKTFGCDLNSCGIDATGLGRALGELLRFVMKSEVAPMKFVSTRRGATAGVKKKVTDPGIETVNPTDMWTTLKAYIQQGQIRGLDEMTIYQLANRRVELNKNVLILENKTDYKARMTVANPAIEHSPDEADSMIIALMTAIHRLGFTLGKRLDVSQYVVGNDLWAVKMRAMQAGRRMEIAEEQKSGPVRPMLAPEFSEGFGD